MKFSRKEVFEIVDALFHKYASTYRAEAREELTDMIQDREDMSQEKRAADKRSADDLFWINFHKKQQSEKEEPQ